MIVGKSTFIMEKKLMGKAKEAATIILHRNDLAKFEPPLNPDLI